MIMKETKIESHYSSSVITRTMDDSSTNTLVSPPDTRTPPLAAGKRNHLNRANTKGVERAGPEPIDANALSKALKDFEDAGRTRERTPGGSPSRKRQRIYGDRLVRHRCLLRMRWSNMMRTSLWPPNGPKQARLTD